MKATSNYVKKRPTYWAYCKYCGLVPPHENYRNTVSFSSFLITVLHERDCAHTYRFSRSSRNCFSPSPRVTSSSLKQVDTGINYESTSRQATIAPPVASINAFLTCVGLEHPRPSKRSSSISLPGSSPLIQSATSGMPSASTSAISLATPAAASSGTPSGSTSSLLLSTSAPSPSALKEPEPVSQDSKESKDEDDQSFELALWFAAKKLLKELVTHSVKAARNPIALRGIYLFL